MAYRQLNPSTNFGLFIRFDILLYRNIKEQYFACKTLVLFWDEGKLLLHCSPFIRSIYILTGDKALQLFFQQLLSLSILANCFPKILSLLAKQPNIPYSITFNVALYVWFAKYLLLFPVINSCLYSI